MPLCTRLIAIVLAPLLLTLSTGCDRSEKTSYEAPEKQQSAQQESSAPDNQGSWSPELMGEYPIETFDNFTETGDLPALRKRGQLRLLVDPSRSSALRREATQQDIEIEQAREMARQLGLELVVLRVSKFNELIPTLLAGKGDIIANNLLITDERQQRVEFSLPTAETRQVLVSAADTPEVVDGAKLAGKTLAVTAGTAFEVTATELAAQHPGLKVVVSDDNYTDLLIEVAKGNTDFTIVDELVLELAQQFRDDLKINRVLSEEQPLAWAIRPDSPELLTAINESVRLMRLTGSRQRFTGDLDQIKERGVLRAVTRNHPGTYFMWKGQILGFEFSLLEKYAADIGVRLEILVADRHDDFVRALETGRADIAASLLAVTERRKREGMAFSTPYIESRVGIVARSGDAINSIGDLDGRRVYVRPSSSQYDVAERLRRQVPGLKIELAPEELDIQQVIDRVADDDYDLAIADKVSVKLEQAWREDIEFALPLPDQDSSYAWMMRANNPALLASVNAFFAKPKIDEVLPSLYARYFESPKRTRPEITELTDKGKISPFDDVVQRYAEKFDFDWRLLVAQMFQESNFNPKAKSWVGARGLMQVMPNTGKQVGETNLFDPETSVRAGVKYLDWLHRKFDDKGISPDNMMWFTLAAYNAGLGHVYDAQDLAEKKGWNRHVWFDNVEKAMLLLSDPKHYKQARYGYARGQEPFDYVRKIEARFRSFVNLLDAHERQQQSSAPPAPQPLAAE